MASAAGRRRKGKAIAAIARPEKEAIPAPDDTPSISTSGLTVDEEKTLGIVERALKTVVLERMRPVTNGRFVGANYESPEWSQAFRDGFRFTISEDRSSLQGFYPAPPARGKRVRKPINVTFPVPSAIGPLPNDWQPPTSASERVPNPHPATLWAWHILDNMATQCADGPASDLMLGEESGKLDWQSWSSRFRDVRRMKDWSNRAALFAAIGRWPQPNVLIPELSSQSAGEALAVQFRADIADDAGTRLVYANDGVRTWFRFRVAKLRDDLVERPPVFRPVTGSRLVLGELVASDEALNTLTPLYRDEAQRVAKSIAECALHCYEISRFVKDANVVQAMNEEAQLQILQTFKSSRRDYIDIHHHHISKRFELRLGPRAANVLGLGVDSVIFWWPERYGVPAEVLQLADAASDQMRGQTVGEMPKTILAFGKEMDDTFVLPLGIQGASVRISGDVFPAHYRSWWRKQTSSADICAGALDIEPCGLVHYCNFHPDVRIMCPLTIHGVCDECLVNGKQRGIDATPLATVWRRQVVSDVGRRWELSQEELDRAEQEAAERFEQTQGVPDHESRFRVIDLFFDSKPADNDIASQVRSFSLVKGVARVFAPLTGPWRLLDPPPRRLAYRLQIALFLRDGAPSTINDALEAALVKLIVQLEPIQTGPHLRYPPTYRDAYMPSNQVTIARCFPRPLRASVDRIVPGGWGDSPASHFHLLCNVVITSITNNLAKYLHSPASIVFMSVARFIRAACAHEHEKKPETRSTLLLRRGREIRSELESLHQEFAKAQRDVPHFAALRGSQKSRAAGDRLLELCRSNNALTKTVEDSLQVLIPVGVAELFGRDKIPDVDGPSKRAIAPQIVRTQEFYDRMPSLLAVIARHAKNLEVTFPWHFKDSDGSSVPSPWRPAEEHVLNHLWREVWYLVTERVAPKVVELLEEQERRVDVFLIVYVISLFMAALSGRDSGGFVCPWSGLTLTMEDSNVDEEVESHKTHDYEYDYGVDFETTTWADFSAWSTDQLLDLIGHATISVESHFSNRLRGNMRQEAYQLTDELFLEHGLQECRKRYPDFAKLVEVSLSDFADRGVQTLVHVGLSSDMAANHADDIPPESQIYSAQRQLESRTGRAHR